MYSSNVANNVLTAYPTEADCSTLNKSDRERHNAVSVAVNRLHITGVDRAMAKEQKPKQTTVQAVSKKVGISASPGGLVPVVKAPQKVAQIYSPLSKYRKADAVRNNKNPSVYMTVENSQNRHHTSTELVHLAALVLYRCSTQN